MISRRYDLSIMAAITAVFGIVTIACAERIGINGGQGWDGMGYTLWARDFSHEVLQKGVTIYHAQRLLPSALIHYALTATGTATDARVIFGYQIVDVIAMVGTAVLWSRVARTLSLSRAASWAGFAALSLGFATARHALYYPTLTDPTACFLGMAATWAYLEDRPFAQIAVAFASAFTWPALLPVSLAMLVLRKPAPQLERVSARWIRWVALGLAVIAAGIVCVAAWRWLQRPYPNDEKWARYVHRDLLPVTFAAIFVMTALGLYVVAREQSLWNLKSYGKQLLTKRLAIAAVGCALVLVAQRAWIARVGTQGPGPTFDQFQCEHLLAALRGPLWNIVSQVVYFGPIALVAIGAWRQIAKRAAEWGPTAAIALAMVVAFWIGTQSRQMIHLLPFLVTITISATASWWTTRRTLVFAVLCLAWSKLWWHIGYDEPANAFEWPNQRYFMNLGPWMSDDMFYVQLAGAVVTAIVLFALFRSSARDHNPVAVDKLGATTE
ncbi:MAG: hypothetical protein JWO36_3797 [Myxococcales bacterium]|nr:hypothetical protein [Myxococcales bacterium]